MSISDVTGDRGLAPTGGGTEQVSYRIGTKDFFPADF
jgi:hypothetical protein